MFDQHSKINQEQLEYFGTGFLVTIGQDRWGNWAWVRLTKPKDGKVSIRFQLVTGGRYNNLVFNELTMLAPPNQHGHGALIRLPDSLSWDVLKRLYVVVQKRRIS